MKISKNKLIYSAISLLMVIVASFYICEFRNTSINQGQISAIVLLALSVFIFELYANAKIQGKWLNPSFFFLLAFYFFQNGQILLLALGLDFDAFYLNYFEECKSNVIVFSSISAMIAGFSAICMAKNDRALINQQKTNKIDRLNPNMVTSYSFYAFILCGLVALPLVLIKFSFALGGGYSAVRNFEYLIPSVVDVLEYLFFPFGLLYMSFENRWNLKKKIVFFVLVLWFIITAMCGDRTTGITGIFILAYFRYLDNTSDKISIRKIFSFLLVMLVLLFLIRLAYAFRTQSGMDGVFSGLETTIISVISELGFSCFPLFTMMKIVPGSEAFLYGKQYVYSVIGGFIPTFIDVTGVIKSVNNEALIFETWQSKYFPQFDFGLGFSLNAEAYINFGWCGLIAIFVVCLLIFYFINKNAAMMRESSYGKYTSLILLFTWMTLPRRSTYYIWNSIFYCIFVINIYLRVTCKARRN